MSFGVRLKQFRTDMGLSQAQLASLARLKAPTISQYESDLREPGLDVLKRLAGALNISVSYLIGEGETGFDQIIPDPEFQNLARTYRYLPNIKKVELFQYWSYLLHESEENRFNIGMEFQPGWSLQDYASEIIKTRTDGTIPVDIELLAKQVGLSVFEVSMENEEYEAYLISRSGRAVAFIKKHSFKKRLTIAHLIAHLMLPWHQGTCYRCRKEGASLTLIEGEATEFGAELILPRNKFIEDISGHIPDLTLLKNICKRYDASIPIAAYRIARLSEKPCAVIISKGSKITHFLQSQLMFRTTPTEIPKGAAAQKCNMVNDELSRIVPADLWKAEPQYNLLIEEAICYLENNHVVTLLHPK